MSGGDFFDDIFHACALRAWIDVAQTTGRWPPDTEATRRLAYALYERELRKKNEPASAAAAKNPIYTSPESCHVRADNATATEEQHVTQAHHATPQLD